MINESDYKFLHKGNRGINYENLAVSNDFKICAVSGNKSKLKSN